MKFEKLQKMLTKKYEDQKRYNNIKQEFKDKKRKKEPKIIGITGSNGKSTVAYLVHEYLKSEGYKSVLYSSLGIDSPASIKTPNVACEAPLPSEEELLNILEEVDAYDADFLVLEVNETAIEKGLVKDIDFDIRVLTNLNPKHNLELYDENEYVELKKEFFQDVKSGKMVIGLEDMTKEMYEEFLKLNELEKLTYSTDYISEVRGVNKKNIDVLLYDMNKKVDGQVLKVLVDNKEYIFDTKLIMSYNALNVLGVITILKALGVLKMNKFMKYIEDKTVPGRAVLKRVNNRSIIIDLNLGPVLEEYAHTKVVIGLIGRGYKHWAKKFKEARFLNSMKALRKEAMELLNKKADFVYLTSNDPGSEDPTAICQELKSYLTIPTDINTNRKEAIKQALIESKAGDVIFIAGRGNRYHFCTGEDELEFFTDEEVVEEVLKDLGW